jgi:PAS domain S-box-containing protein
MSKEEGVKVKKIFREKLANKEAFHGLENTNRHRDGHLIVLETSGVPILDKNGQARGYRGTDRNITERKKSEAFLQDSEERLKILFEYAPDGYYLFDKAGTFLDGNRMAEILSGYQREELIGKSFLRLGLMPFSQLPKAATALAKNILGKAAGPDGFTLLRKDGTEMEVEIRTYPVKIKGETVILGIARDITERKRGEQELRESEARYKALFVGAAEGILVADIETKQFSYANPAMCRMFGYAEEEFLRLGVPDLLSAEAGAAGLEEFEAHVRGEKMFTPGLSLRGKDGSPFFVSIHSSLMILDGRQCIMGFFNDITERKRIEEEKTRLLTIIEESKDFIGVADPQGNLLYHNRAAKRMVGLPEDADLSHMKIRDMHPGWAAKIVEEEGIPAILREGSWKGENALLHRNGSEIPVSQLLLLHRDPLSGKPAFISTIMRDITENKRLTEALKKSHENLEIQVRERTAELVRSFQKLQAVGEDLQRAGKAKSEFLANMSHEFRTPLNSIIGFSEVLYDERFGPLNERQKKYTENVMASGRHLLSLINEVLDLSKVEAGKMALDLASFSILGCMEEVLRVMESQALLKKIKTVLEVPEDFDEIYGDERKIKQVIYNLLANAIKFTPAGGKVGIRGGRIDTGIEVTVWDTGIGISSENLEKVFGAFERLDNIYVQETEGTGLGLTISRKMIELHGGKMWIESEGIGKGTAVKFTLPSRGVK